MNIYVTKALQDRHPQLAYVHFVEPRGVAGDGRLKPTDDPKANLAPFRQAWKGVFMSAGGYDAKTGVDQIEAGRADLVAFGRLFLANPDLVKRIEKSLPINAYDRSTFYTNDAKGYVDYPFYETPNLVSNL
jgi:2,4-dienoyl-CoA reductase-like NADH-dependent reductase (Old Yellow Enzyme family)